MVKVQQKASWDASSLSGSDSDDSSSGSSSKNSSRSNNEESSSDSSEPSSAKNERLKSFSDNHFRDTGNGDMGNKMREKDDYRYSTRPSKQDGGGSKAESEDLTPEINNGAYKWPGQVRRSQRLPNDIENQYETEDSRRAIKKRTLTEESSHLSDETPENLDDKPIEEKPRLPTRERKIITCLTLFLTCLCLLATLGIGIAIGLASAKDESSLSRGVDPALVPTTPPTRSQTTPTVAPQAPSSNSPLETFKPTEDTLLDLLIANSFDDGATLLTAGTPQRSAYEWLSQNTNITEYADDVKLARYALATFYFSTNGPTTWDEEIREGAWMTDAPECEWATTASNQCSDNAYTSLTLDFVGVSGQIPEELALLTGLTRLSIRSEGVGSPSLSGSLPESIGMLENLETIRLNENNIGGVLPTTIGGLSNIRVFLLGGNSIGGTIPSEIGLTGGNTFNFDRNELSGKLPPELFAMETLTALNFEENSLSGTIPTEIGLNPSLNSVNFASNRLTGTIPSEIGSLVTARGKLYRRFLVSISLL